MQNILKRVESCLIIAVQKMGLLRTDLKKRNKGNIKMELVLAIVSLLNFILLMRKTSSFRERM